MDSPAAARAHIEDAWLIRTDDLEIWNTAGRVRSALGDSLGAMAAYRNAAQLTPKDWDIRRYLGYALYTAGDVVGALQEMKRSVELKPRGALSHWTLGRMLSASNRPDQALLHLREATLLAPNDAALWFDLAVTEERLGHVLASRHALTADCLSAGPDSVRARPLRELPADVSRALRRNGELGKRCVRRAAPGCHY